MGLVRTSRKRRVYESVLSAYAQLNRLVERRDRGAVRELVEKTGLAVTRDPVLFELIILFDAIAVLRTRGWAFQYLGLVEGSIELQGTRGAERITLWYQRSPRDLGRGSIRTQVLRSHGVDVGATLPDIVIKLDLQQGSRWVLIECKWYFDPSEGARVATTDLLAYRRSFEAVLSNSPQPYGIGAIWGAELEPVAGSEILLCTPDRLEHALSMAAP